jgi:two-component system aerobic respiration control sensor histidine kinase ArcB
MDNKNMSTPGKLGLDLPDTEQALFELDTFPVFDETLALGLVGGSQTLLVSVLNDFVGLSIPEDIKCIQDAYTKHDWTMVQKIAHRMKGGVEYCGAPKMKHACQYLERYHKAGYTSQLEKLYHQLLRVTDLTRLTIGDWLKQQTRP